MIGNGGRAIGTIGVHDFVRLAKTSDDQRQDEGSCSMRLPQAKRVRRWISLVAKHAADLPVGFGER